VKDRALKEVGDHGEKLALDHLLGKGLRLLLRNYRCKGGELDLVMLDGDTLALIEVRVRGDSSLATAAESVTPRKQQRLIVAARHLLMTHRELGHYRARFDVVALDDDTPGPARLEWIRDAFRL
jgi:putative endonuclease